MDNWDNHTRDAFHDKRDREGNDGNKIRRGPGRRIAKEKRKRYMDPVIQNKYLALPEDAQLEVHALIEMHYQRQMQDRYKETSFEPDSEAVLEEE